MSTQEAIANQAKQIIDASSKKVTAKKLAELIHHLINDLPLAIDMSVVESVTLQVMKNNYISFKGSLEVCEMLPEDQQENFDGTCEYFFEQVCVPGIVTDQIESLINQFIKI